MPSLPASSVPSPPPGPMPVVRLTCFLAFRLSSLRLPTYSLPTVALLFLPFNSLLPRLVRQPSSRPPQPQPAFARLLHPALLFCPSFFPITTNRSLFPAFFSCCFQVSNVGDGRALGSVPACICCGTIGTRSHSAFQLLVQHQLAASASAGYFGLGRVSQPAIRRAAQRLLGRGKYPPFFASACQPIASSRAGTSVSVIP